MLQRGRQALDCRLATSRATNSACVETYKGTLGTTWLPPPPITVLEYPHYFPNRCSWNPITLFRARGIMLSEMTPHTGITSTAKANVIQYLYRYFLVCKGKVHPCTGTEALYRPYGRQLPATTNVCKTRGCNYSYWAPDDERCVTRNTLSN